MSERYRIYVAGPISGHELGNEPAFRVAAAWISATLCAEPIVPHDLYRPPFSECPCITWCKAMTRCLDAIKAADAVYFLPGWHLSTGARRELVEANKAGKRLIFE